MISQVKYENKLHNMEKQGTVSEKILCDGWDSPGPRCSFAIWRTIITSSIVLRYHIHLYQKTISSTNE